MSYLLKYISLRFPGNIKTVPYPYPSKEAALVSIPGRERLRNIEYAYGTFKDQAEPCIWIIEEVSQVEASELLAKADKEDNEVPYFAR